MLNAESVLLLASLMAGSAQPAAHPLLRHDVVVDEHGTIWYTNFGEQFFGRVDAKTGAHKEWPIPILKPGQLEGTLDLREGPDGNMWIALMHQGALAKFDTKTEKFQEWQAPTPFSAPYDGTIDKTGHVWTGSMTTDRVIRLDPKTGKMDEYLLPRSTNIRRVFVDDRGAIPALWVGNNHGASIVKLEPLD